MLEVDRDLVCSGIISKLLHSRPGTLDVETEQITRSYLATDLISLYKESRRSKYGTRLSSIPLTNDYSHGTY
jgi:predicted glutamine amidotransferase